MSKATDNTQDGLWRGALAGRSVLTSVCAFYLDLKAYTVYQYRIIVRNEKGEADSEWASVRTLETHPTDLMRPVISSLGAYSMKVTWSYPLNPNGLITCKSYSFFVFFFDLHTCQKNGVHVYMYLK